MKLKNLRRLSPIAEAYYQLGKELGYRFRIFQPRDRRGHDNEIVLGVCLPTTKRIFIYPEPHWSVSGYVTILAHEVMHAIQFTKLGYKVRDYLRTPGPFEREAWKEANRARRKHLRYIKRQLKGKQNVAIQ